MIEIEIRVESADGDIDSIWPWLSEIRELRGHLRDRSVPQAGTMGVETVIGLVLSTAALARACTPLARALSEWLVERERLKRSDVVIVTGPNGKTQLSVSNTADAERLLRSLFTIDQLDR